MFRLTDLTSLALRTFVFEGVNGSGKSTALKTVAERLRADGYSVRTFADPGSHAAAKALRVILKSKEYILDSNAQLLLFTTARRLLLQEMMGAHTDDRCAVMLVDRWVWSTLAYQCASGVDSYRVFDLYSEFSPLDVSSARGATAFLLDIDAMGALARTRVAQGQDVQVDPFEAAGTAYLDQVVANYRRTCLYIRAPLVIDATRSPEVVAEACYKHILARNL